MAEHAGAQGVGAKLWSEPDDCRRSRLLADQNFGGAQGEVGWINCRRSRSTRPRTGAPLAHQRGRASVRLANQHTEPGRGRRRGRYQPGEPTLPWAALDSRLARSERLSGDRLHRGGLGGGLADGAAAPEPGSLRGLLAATARELVATVGATGDPPAVQQVHGRLTAGLNVHHALLDNRGVCGLCGYGGRLGSAPLAGAWRSHRLRPAAGRRATTPRRHRRQERACWRWPGRVVRPRCRQVRRHAEATPHGRRMTPGRGG
jgi:hypothetical protein